MTITPLPALIPDVAAPIAPAAPALGSQGSSASGSSANAFAKALDTANAALDRADAAESAFTHGHGGLQEMVVERARADVMLSIATTAVSRTTQAVSTVMGMQI